MHHAARLDSEILQKYGINEKSREGGNYLRQRQRLARAYIVMQKF